MGTKTTEESKKDVVVPAICSKLKTKRERAKANIEKVNKQEISTPQRAAKRQKKAECSGAVCNTHQTAGPLHNAS